MKTGIKKLEENEMKSLLAQIENLIREKVEEHIDITDSFREHDAPKAKEIAVRELVESATEDMAEALVKAFATPTIKAYI